MRRILTWTLAAATCGLFYALWWVLCREPKFVLTDYPRESWYPLTGGTAWNHTSIGVYPVWGSDCTIDEWDDGSGHD